MKAPFAVWNPHALKVHPKRQTGEWEGGTPEMSYNMKFTIELRAERQGCWRHKDGTDVLMRGSLPEGKLFHISVLAFLICLWATIRVGI